MTDLPERIAYVDDDPIVRTMVELAFSSFSRIELLTLASGDEALAKLPSARPDLILLDVMMPGMGGEETLRRLREARETAKTPVIYLSGKIRKAHADAFLAPGVVGVMRKPFDPKTLVDEVLRIWRESMAAAAEGEAGTAA